MILGILTMIAGLVLMVMGKMWGLLMILFGAIALMVRYARMMHGRGYDPEQGSINGLTGQGKQTPDVVSTNQPPVGEQSANIWKQMEQ
jgi:predicted lipid-binding transport protein (Tim44 family)